MKIEEEGDQEVVDIDSYEAFITKTLQPRLEELLGQRDNLARSKHEYDLTAVRLAELSEMRDMVQNDERDDGRHRVTCWVDVGNRVFANAVSTKPIHSMKISIQGLQGSIGEYSVDEGLLFVEKQVAELESKLNRLDKDIAEVVADVESCLSSVHQLKALSTRAK